MKRRRLSPLARVSYHVLSHCVGAEINEPLVFSSMMGEIQRTQTMLEGIAADEIPSPTAFSLSVHNAIGGLWSMIHGNTASVTALSSSLSSAVPALLEASAMLQEPSVNAVTVLFCDESYPAFYAPFFAGPPGLTALAMRVVGNGACAAGTTIDLTLQRHAVADRSAQASAYPGLLPVLKTQAQSTLLADFGSDWLLERAGE